MAKQYRKGEKLITLFKLLKDHPDGVKPKEAIEKPFYRQSLLGLLAGQSHEVRS